MDPKATLEQADQAISDERYPEAIDLLRVYWNWRLAGGFEPIHNGIRGRNRGDAIADKLTDTIIDRLENR